MVQKDLFHLYFIFTQVKNVSCHYTIISLPVFQVIGQEVKMDRDYSVVA